VQFACSNKTSAGYIFLLCEETNKNERETNERSMKLAAYTYTYILNICDC
jgi:hypothetical protein